MKRSLLAAAIAGGVHFSSGAAAAPTALEEVVVTSEFRAATAADVPASVSVLGPETITAAAVQHFEELSFQVPNLNYSGDGARARYFQIRGIGELEQYEGAPNPSVGFVIDDIDFSALGGIADLFDTEQIEVLRGPQGSRYGANALGGLIYVRSTPPPDTFAADFESTLGSDNTWGLGAAVGGPLSDTLGYRVSAHRYRSDGVRHNAFLDRNDTDGRNEKSAKAKFRWHPSERVSLDFTTLLADFDDGYDAWSIDNGFTTYSDHPGRDAQLSAAGAVRLDVAFDAFDLVSISSAMHSEIAFDFDADWGNADYWAPYVYDYVSTTARDRRTRNQELRLESPDGAFAGGRGSWLVGLYVLTLDERNERLDQGIYDDGEFCTPCVLDAPLTSDYAATSSALFGRIDLDLSSALTLGAGLRAERRDADYNDSVGNQFAPVDDMWGGELSLLWALSAQSNAYLRLARGYKAGGFNIGLNSVDFANVDGLTPGAIEFGAETLTSLEGGIKGEWLERRLVAELGVFVSRRHDQQVKVPVQLRAGDPSSFVFVTENAERARDSGLESSVAWQANARWRVFGTLGLLDTAIERFSLLPSLVGRAEAHAPRYSASVGAEYRVGDGWWGRVDVFARDSFYFDYGHDQRSEPYSLTNLRIGRDWGPWEAALWIRNAFDKSYSTRGFFFGNEPPDFPDMLYLHRGDPRQYGVTVRYHR